MTNLIDVPRGLKGVAAAETRIGDVRGGEGFYHYGPYNATRLAREQSLEEAWFLVRTGRLPDEKELEAFTQLVAAHRALPQEVTAALPTVAGLASEERPLEALRAAYELFALVKDYQPWLDLDPEMLDRQAVETAAVFAPIVVALYRLARGEQPIPPRDDLGHAANYLYMLEGQVPGDERVRALEAYLISTIDHGFNASTFTARVVASTGADVASAVIAAIGALSGPLHGGAPSRVLDMLDAIGEPANAEAWLRAALERGEKLMGFGHPVYRTTDPRNVMLREVAAELGSERLAFAAHVEETGERLLRERKPDHPLYANVEFYASIVLDAVGLPRALFTPTFAVSRVIGWTAHVVEQTRNNAILRPSARYVGPEPSS
ncbi:MAG TPA: citrate synthase [Gaiellaceae bacterium]|nr:citrate synthase [Gaiellaceae bacterium]